MNRDKLKLIAARAVGLLAILVILFMDHQLFMPFGLFIMFGLFALAAYLYRDFTDPKPLNENQSYWHIVFGMIVGGFGTEILRATNINLTTKHRIMLFIAIVLITAIYTMFDAEKKIGSLKTKKLANKAL